MLGIIINNYNKSPWIEECVSSLVSQTYRDWECIFVDDCSTDDSLEIAEWLTGGDSRFTVMSLKQQWGSSMSRKIALDVFMGLDRITHVAFIDSDDYLTQPTFLERIMQRMTAFSSLKIAVFPRYVDKHHSTYEPLRSDNWKNDFFNCNSPLHNVYRKDVFVNVEWLEPSFNEDFYINVQIVLFIDTLDALLVPKDWGEYYYRKTEGLVNSGENAKQRERDFLFYRPRIINFMRKHFEISSMKCFDKVFNEGEAEFKTEATSRLNESWKSIHDLLTKTYNYQSIKIQRYFGKAFVCIDIVNYCNYNCKTCSHYSNLVGEDKQEAMSLNDFKYVLRELRRIFGDSIYLSILGGEPLLHPLLSDFLYAVREYFPKETVGVRLTSNGLLFRERLPGLVPALQDNDITLVWSDYGKTEPTLRSWVSSLPIHFFRMPLKHHVPKWLLNYTINPKHAKTNCFSQCIHVFKNPFDGGKYALTACAEAGCLQYFLTRFGDQLSLPDTFKQSPDDFRTLERLKKLGDVFDWLHDPQPFCKHCQRSLTLQSKDILAQQGEPDLESFINFSVPN
jgi:glycosyltransferase involved in cell wall biosynthesis